MIARFGPHLFLLLLVAGSFWLVGRMSDEKTDAAGRDRRVADLYVTDFKTTTMGQNGKPVRQLEAERLAHFPDTGTKELESPYIIIYHPTRSPWHVRSERGWVSANGDVMLLLGEVHIWRDSDEGVRELDLRTSDLRVLPESQYGETDQLVVITTPNSESRGIGMRAYLSQRRIELLSQVRTVYETEAP